MRYYIKSVHNGIGRYHAAGRVRDVRAFLERWNRPGWAIEITRPDGARGRFVRNFGGPFIAFHHPDGCVEYPQTIEELAQKLEE